MDSVLIKPAQSIKIPYHALISSNGILRTAITTLLVATHLIKIFPRAMINKTYLFEKLLSYCDNIQGVDEQVLDAHLQKHGLTLRADHRSFLLKYGNSTELLKFGFGDCTYVLFEKYTSNPQRYLNDNLPDDTVFFGQEFTDGILCIDNQFGKIYDYESKELWGCFYENIDVLLFFCLIEYLWNHKKIVTSTEIIGSVEHS